MSNPPKSSGRGPRQTRNVFITKSGKSVKVNRSISEKRKARKDERFRKKAAYLSTLPTNRLKRILARLEPRRVFKYWFSRDGAIMALKIFGIGVVVMFLLIIGMFAYFRKDLPNIKDISGSNLGGSTAYYDSTGKVLLWEDYNAVKRIPVQSNQISPYIKDATVAVEDKSFYHEGAFDVRGIARAAFHDLFSSGGGLQGGSTITQQLVKLNENWTDNRTVTRKVKEIILAVELEREYSKSDILTGYLNIAPYGGIDYGAEAAAEDYFHDTAATLTLPQAALLAAIPQSPDVYAPNSADFSRSETIARYDYVLTLMAQQGYITTAQANAAKQVDVIDTVQPLQSKYHNIKAPYFVLAAKNQLETQYGSTTVDRGGWKVITTLNLADQSLAQKLVAANLPNVEDDHGDEEAIVAESVPTGQVLAEVGGTDFNNPDYGQINFAQTKIPPGSSFKPYDYTSLINDTTDAGAGSVLYDNQQPLPGYPCTNKGTPPPVGQGNCLEDYDFKYPGPEEIRYALAGSRNVPAAKAMLSVIPNTQCEEGIVSGCVPSINKVISTADALMDVPNAYQCYSDTALTQPDQCYASSAFGDGAFLHLDQHVNGLASLARLGQAIPQTYIKQITDSNNKIIYKWTPPVPVQVVKTDSAYIVDNMLSDPNASYLPSFEKFQHYNGWDFAVKTGTTNDDFDGLMMSWSTQIAVGSWVGYHTRNVALTAGQFEYLTEPLTRSFIEGATDMLHMNPVNWKQPSDIKVLPSFVQRTHIDYGDVEPGPSTDIYPAWYVPPVKKTSNTNEVLDKVSGDLATNCTPSLAKESVSNSNVNAFSADIFWPIGNASATTTTAQDTVHSCSDSPPTVTVTQSDQGGTASCDTVTGCSFTVTVQAGTHALNDSKYPKFPGTINLLVNGNQVATSKIPQTDCTGTPEVCTVPISYTPAASDAGQQITVSAQAIDSVLYEGTSGPITVPVATAPPANPPTNTTTPQSQ